MQVVLLRVGVDTGSGGIHGPLFRDRSFELVSIPDRFGGTGVDKRTYGNTFGRHGRHLLEYFPQRLRKVMQNQPMHLDPEFETFTYGDPTRPKSSLKKLRAGDLLIFYGGFQGWGFEGEPGLYIIGYFEVERAALATNLTVRELESMFAQNFHVRHAQILESQRERLVLVKGGPGSRLLRKGHLISSIATDRRGRPLKVLSPYAQEIFGDFDGRVSIQRSPPRWVVPKFAKRAASFVRKLQ